MPNRRLDVKLYQRFGKLKVMESAGVDRHGKILWKCHCDCGGDTIVSSSHLRRGPKKGTKSCGCLGNWKARRLPPQKYLAQRVGSMYRRTAIKRKLKWKLTEDELLQLIQQDCFYCGQPPSNTIVRQGQILKYSGIDRVRNVLGYTSGNTVPCCGPCNQMKSDRSLDEFVSHISKIFTRLVELKVGA